MFCSPLSYRLGDSLLFIIRSVLTVKACQGNRYRLPVAGDLAGRDAHQSETGLTARDRAVKAQGRADQVTLISSM